MISKKQLLNIYNTELKPQLASFEKQRKIVIALYIVAIIPLIISFGMAFGSAINYDYTEESRTIMMYAFMAAFIVFGLFFFFISIAQKKKSAYISRFKKDIVSMIVPLLEPKWTYKKDAQIGSIEYNASKLFTKPYDDYNGEDLVYGKMGKTEFKSSELRTSYNIKNHGSTEYHTIFNGLFFHSDFNKNFIGETFIVHGDLKDQAMTFSNTSSKTKVVKLENTQFAKTFATRSTNQIEARYILTPNIMEALLRVQKLVKCAMFISFVNKRMYCAISLPNGLFETSIFSKINFEKIEKMYDLYNLNAIIIEELNLNTRIWTKN